jgi:hypothetical protein
MSLYVINTYAEIFDQYRTEYNIFLDAIKDDKSPALANMGYLEPAGLGFLVANKVRWTKNTGQIALLINDNDIVGVSAVETCSLSNAFGSGGNRCWLLPEYRTNNEITQHLLSSNLQWSTQQNHLGMMLTFNGYNKWIYDTIAKRASGKSSALGKVWSNWWNDCIPFETQLNVFSTPQWAVIKPINKSAPAIVDAMKNIEMEFSIV